MKTKWPAIGLACVLLTGTSYASATQSQPQPPPPQQGSAPQPTATSAGFPAAVAPQGAPRYSGEPIRVNFKDVDLQDFFRLIHEVSGLNVVLDPAVKGNLTLVMDDVPWDQVLDIVLKNNSLEKELDGNVLRIATQATLKSEAEIRAAVLQAREESVEPVTVTRRLSYAKASQQGGQAGGAGRAQQGKGMDDLIRPFLSKRGSVFGDMRTNTLIVRDIPTVIPRIDELIRQLDRKSQQVEIEARVVLASRSFAQDLGTQFAFQSTAGNSIIGGLQSLLTGSTSSSGSGGGTTPPTGPGSFTLPLNSNLPAIGPTSGILYSFKSTNFALDFAITAMESKGVGKLISSPKVVTQNNAEGIVQQGTQIPIQTNINNTISTQYVNAVLQLKVTPQITADGTIFMIVHLENTQIDAGIPAILGQPALATQSVDNSVIARDGETIMLGGVMVNSQATTVNEVPLIGSIPLIGNLFKRRLVKVDTQQLFFFLTPRVSQD
jgi:type IV pilus assembly protein PilQ